MAGSEEIQRVDRFTSLGTTLNSHWDYAQEIRSRIEMARSTFIKLRYLLCCSDLSLGTKMWIMWIYRRILKISYVDHVTNVEVLQCMTKEKELLNLVKQRKLEYLGHVMRNEEKYRILQFVMQGKVFGRRRPGRRRISWLNSTMVWDDLRGTVS
ncbi:unnamed protein product [Diabrotica balteata]|uniref:Uncharacterized protein n=1 Tax=Diabrotica balteata TaxID=107213 RepID=A0A9N9XK40_DIABA|nr:unnamed protein product [Diabrotica balteata]